MLWRHYGDRRRAEVAAARAGRFLGAGIIGIGAAELLLWGAFGGLWLMLIGWFLILAADAERRAATAAAALEGVRVAEIMTADPQVAHAWLTVQDFIDRVATWSRQDAFPVVDPGGTLIGVVVTDLLARILPGDRVELRLDRAALAVPPPYLAGPEDPAEPLLTHRPLGGEVLAIVLAGGQVVGMVTVSDLRQAVRRRKLAAPMGAGQGGKAGTLAVSRPGALASRAWLVDDAPPGHGTPGRWLPADSSRYCSLPVSSAR